MESPTEIVRKSIFLLFGFRKPATLRRGRKKWASSWCWCDEVADSIIYKTPVFRFLVSLPVIQDIMRPFFNDSEVPFFKNARNRTWPRRNRWKSVTLFSPDGVLKRFSQLCPFRFHPETWQSPASNKKGTLLARRPFFDELRLVRLTYFTKSSISVGS